MSAPGCTKWSLGGMCGRCTPPVHTPKDNNFRDAPAASIILLELIRRAQHLPTVLLKDEVARMLGGMQGLHQLIARLLYGCGLCLMECLRLRIK